MTMYSDMSRQISFIFATVLLSAVLSIASGFVAPVPCRPGALMIRSFDTSTIIPSFRRERSSTSFPLSVHPFHFSSLTTAYSDDPLGDLLFGANGVVIAGILATTAAVGAGFITLLPKVGSAKFTLTEAEENACKRVDNAYDSAGWEKEVIEEGTKGYVNRRRLALEAKERYQTSSGVARRELKDRSLRYSEADLGFIACLLRAANPEVGDVCYDLGSGTGRSTMALATIFPSFSRVVGIEFLGTLTKMANSYRGKVRGSKAKVQFETGDIAGTDLSTADCVFLGPASFMSDDDLGAALSSLPCGATIMTIDKRLGSGFSLVTQVEDPSGDLVLNTGYVYRRN